VRGSLASHEALSMDHAKFAIASKKKDLNQVLFHVLQ
jgi:hypothetical protein